MAITDCWVEDHYLELEILGPGAAAVAVSTVRVPAQRLGGTPNE